MKQIATNHSGGAWLVRAALATLLIGLLGQQHALAGPTGMQALDLKMTMETSARISVGEPIVVHYTIKNMEPVGQVTFHTGEKNNEWYTLILRDAKGRTTTVTPPPTRGVTQGLHHGPEVSIPHGGITEGDLVVTQYLAVPGPGTYTLTVHTTTPYYVEHEGAWYPEGRPSDIRQVSMEQDFKFLLAVEPIRPTMLRATAEILRGKLLNVAYDGQWESLTKQLFSLPEAEALPSWQTLVTDGNTPDPVLLDASEALGNLPSSATVQLLGQLAFCQSDKPNSSDGLVRSKASKALANLYNTSGAGPRLQIERVFLSHGISRSRLIEIATASQSH